MRCKKIDIAKGIGIILVVLGHAFPDASSANGISNPICRYIFEFIYSFHMPMFFVLSGVLVKNIGDLYKASNVLRNKVKNRVIRLLVPYFVWGGIYLPFRYVLARYANSSYEFSSFWKIMVGHNPYSGLWFLYALFLISILTYLAAYFFKRLDLMVIIAFVMLIISCFIFIVEPIRWIFAYWFYYLLGVYFSNEIMHNKFFCNSKIGIVSLLFLIIGFSILKLTGFDLFRIITAVAGTIIILWISNLIAAWDSRKIRDMLIRLGEMSGEIYILSGPVLVALRIVLFTKLQIPYLIYVIFAVIVSIFISIVISKYNISKNKMLSILILGRKF